MADKKVSIIYTIKDKASKGVKKINNSIKDLTSSTLSSAVGFAAVSAATVALIKDFANFESAMIDVGNLTNASREEVNKMSNDLIEMSKDVPIGMSDLTDSLFDVVSAGVSAGESIEFLESSARLATAGATTTKVAVDGLTSIINAYGLEASDATIISDKFFSAQQRGKTTIEELSLSVGKVAPLANSMGISIDELLASVSALTLGGIKTSEAVTGIRATLSNVLKPSSQAAKLSRELGLEFNEQALSAKGLNLFLKETIEATGGNTEALSLLFGSVEAVNSVLALSKNNFRDVNSIQTSVQDSLGSTEKAFTEKLNSINSQLAITKNEILGLSKSLLSNLSPAIVKVLDLFNKSFDITRNNLKLTKQIGSGIISFFKAVNETEKKIISDTQRMYKDYGTYIKSENQSIKDDTKSKESEITVDFTQELGKREDRLIASNEHKTEIVNNALNLIKGANKEETESAKLKYTTILNEFQLWKAEESAVRDISLKEELKALDKIRLENEFTEDQERTLAIESFNLKAAIRKENLSAEEKASRDRMKIIDKELEGREDAYNHMEDMFRSIIDSGVDSQGNAAEAMLKQTLNSVIKQIEAMALLEVGKAHVLAPFSFGASLIAIPAILAASAVAKSAVNSIKLAEGGVVSPSSGGTNAIIGEANRSEAVIPLDSKRGREALGSGGPSEIVLNIDGSRILAKAVYKRQTEMIRSGQIQRRT
jgi:TP901 family phage tail tape measure protein